MNITVATPYDSSNYGAFLQAYCLQQYLLSLGHRVTHIPTRPADYVESLYFHRNPVSKKEKLVPGVYRSHYKFGKKKYDLFRRAQEVFHVTEDLSDTDLMVLGSDEIWNVNNPVFASSVFWGQREIPSISYAASVGDATPETFRYFPDQIEQLRRLRCALVRDENTKRLVETFTDLKPEIVCDPTILWPVENYGEKCQDDYVRKHKCLLIYSYGLSKREVEEIRRYAKARGLKTVACCFHHRWCDHQVECGPLAFPDLIRQCKEYYTTTFHGSIFGMLTHARFVCCSENPKTLDLLRQYGLEDRLIAKADFSARALADRFSARIPYKKTDRLIWQMREESQRKLAAAIDRIRPEAGDPETAPADKAGNQGTAAADRNGAGKVSGETDPLICFPNQCTGCFACRSVCREEAISIVTDAQGRTLPSIDEAKCSHCGACRAICPQRGASVLHEALACYAARGKEPDKIAGSSSGGIAALLTGHFIKDGNIVYGARVSGREVLHAKAQTPEETAAFAGSKYVQSDISATYGEIRQDLAAGRKVLFLGTPCQVDAMNRFFGRNKNFYSADIICHGVPPMEYLRQNLADFTKGRDFDRFRFRGQPDDFTLKVYDGADTVYSQHETGDIYFHAFLTSMTYRENCYNCKYTRASRPGDLTLGDFWGLDHKTLKNTYDGNISVVFVNTEKGRELFEAIRPLLVCEERPAAEAVAGNPQLRRPSLRHRDRKAFMASYMEKHDFRAAVAATGLEREMKRLQFGRTGRGKLYVRVKKLWEKLM